LPEEAWKPLEHLARYEIATEPRRKPQRIKEAIVRFKGYLNKKPIGENVAEFDYQPHKFRRSYRLVVVRKNISVQILRVISLSDTPARFLALGLVIPKLIQGYCYLLISRFQKHIPRLGKNGCRLVAADDRTGFLRP